MNKDWGVLQHFELQADTATALLAACQVVLTDHSSIVAWGVNNGNLELFWTDKIGVSNKLPFPLSSAQELYEFINNWLTKSAQYPKDRPDTDGDVKRGYTVTNYVPYWEVSFVVKPTWIIYGK